MTLQKHNEETISQAFKSYINKTELLMENGMKEVMERALQIALYEMHDKEHPNHLLIDGSYGWILFHDKQEKARNLVALKGNTVAASDILDDIIPTNDSWIGFLVAGMTPSGAKYFNYVYEVDVLNATAEEVGANFYSHFMNLF